MGLTAAQGMWLQAGSQAAGGAVGIGVQRLGINYDHRKQLEQQRKMMEMQIAAEERLMGIQQQKQLEMWEATGYGAQKDQMKRAGLNPALMYGMGGGGGQTVGASMPGISGGTASDPNTRGGMGMMDVANVALIDAQKRLIEAEIKSKEQGTAKTWQETHELQMKNLITEITQAVKPDGSNAQGNIHESAAVKATLAEKLMSSKALDEIAKKIELLREQGETEDQIQKKLTNETQLLKNEIDWQALDISGDNVGSAIEKIIKMVIGVITGAKGLKNTPAKSGKK